MADRQETLSNLIAITGSDDAAALNLLEATDWNLQDAVELYYASNDAHGHGAASNGPGRNFEAEQVRAPMPSKMDRLYGNAQDPRAIAATSAAQFGLNQQRVTPPVDVFRDFKGEGEEAEGKGSGAGLSQLFKPPKDLLFLGDFDMAKMRAAQEGKWILLNIQAHDQFDSHRLNRDTWNHASLKELVMGMFLFCQYDDSSPEGGKLSSMYKVTKLPCILVLDPITGAKLYSKDGFISAENLIEDVVPFMDHGPTDPGAGQMAYAMGLKRKAQEEAAAVAAVTSSRSSHAAMTEDEQIAMALAMSMQREVSKDKTAGDVDDGAECSMPREELDDLEEQAMWEQIHRKQAEEQEALNSSHKTPEQVQQEAAQRLPAEPLEASASACRVALRLPDGQRMQRRFEKHDTVQALLDYVVTLLPEAASGRRFHLIPALPGAQALADPYETIETAKVAGSMLAVKWQ